MEVVKVPILNFDEALLIGREVLYFFRSGKASIASKNGVSFVLLIQFVTGSSSVGYGGRLQGGNIWVIHLEILTEI